MGMNKKCPKCGKDLVDIIYGYPTPECFDAEDEKKIYLGGCCTFDDSPKYHCFNCELDFSEDLAESFDAPNNPTLEELQNENQV